MPRHVFSKQERIRIRKALGSKKTPMPMDPSLRRRLATFLVELAEDRFRHPDRIEIGTKPSLPQNSLEARAMREGIWMAAK